MKQHTETHANYNGDFVLKKGTMHPTNGLGVFNDGVWYNGKAVGHYSSVALYALDIYDKTLNEDELKIALNKIENDI